MPHRAEIPHPYHPRMAHVMRGGPPHPPPVSPAGRMVHPSDAARMAAHHQRARMYAGHPPPSRLPPYPHMLWHPSEAPQRMAVEMEAAAMARHAHPMPAYTHPDAMPREARKREVPIPVEHDVESKRLKHTNSVESPEQTAATALLLAAGGASADSPQASLPMPSESELSENSGSREPLKKRKKHLDFLRRNNRDLELSSSTPTRQPCHVSPVSSDSLGSHADGHSDELSSVASARTPVVQSSRTNSYDLKECPPFTESSQIRDVAETAPPPAHVEFPHFPTVLHSILSHSDFGNVLQWLPHGQAWRILRWDALRRNVLPRHFPQLCQDEDGKGSGSIDSFLWHIRAWGFEEIKDGPDVGAYCHNLFLRGIPKLCKQMSFSSSRGPEVDSPKPSHLREGSIQHGLKSHYESPTSRGTFHSILRVPSLASRSDRESDAKNYSADMGHPWGERGQVERRNEEESVAVQRARLAPNMRCDPGFYDQESPHRGWHSVNRMEPSMRMGYRSDDGFMTESRPFLPESPKTMRTGVMCPPSYDPRFPFRPHPGAAAMRAPLQPQPVPPPPQVRSGRGGTRISESRSSPLGEPQKSSFPVSQRGKGNSRVRVCRIPLSSPTDHGSLSVRSDSDVCSLSTTRTGSQSPNSFGPHLQEGVVVNQVALGVSQKAKRKLPLARKVTNSSVDAPSQMKERP